MERCPHCGKDIHVPPRRIDDPNALERWNQLAEKYGLRPARKMTDTRRRRLRARLREEFCFWGIVEREVRQLNAFARDRGFVDLDYVLRPSGFLALAEGKWREKKTATFNQSDGRPSRNVLDQLHPSVRDLYKNRE